PDRYDLAWIAAVVIPVEDDLVEPRADETRQDGPLPNAHDVVGRQPFALGLAVAEPEPDDDRRRHEDAVPADDDGADLEGDGARRAHDEGKHAGQNIMGFGKDRCRQSYPARRRRAATRRARRRLRGGPAIPSPGSRVAGVARPSRMPRGIAPGCPQNDS